ncbi:MAG: molybdopterin-binding protein, partial [Defluviitaleaceae bacterium]|nr:molybdopterin-binding protein [Defluviitaleaceae bacterium]
MSKRNLYLTNISIEDALERFQSYFQEIGKGVGLVDVKNALNCITAQPIFARNNSPLYDSSAMDGIAVISSKTRNASETSPIILFSDTDFVVVDTGDPVKPPFDAVIMAEELQENEDGSITIREAAASWQNIRPIGEDIVQGEMILPSYHKIRPMDIGVLLSGGITQILVKTPASVGIIPTGSELVEAGSNLKDGDIIESNAYMLSALVAQDGGIPSRYGIVADDYECIKQNLLQAVKSHDMVLICSGTSAGREDYTIHVLREIGEVV